MNILKLSIAILLLTLPSSSFAQKFGKIDSEELKKVKCEEDENADAIKLFEIGELKITPEMELQIIKHVRIKILSEKGKEFSNVSIDYWHEDKLKRLKAHTILPSGKKIKVGKKNKTESKAGNFKSVNIAFPGVETGSIIEYKYNMFSKYITNLEPWYFQDEIFTKLSRLKVHIPKGLIFSYFHENLRGIPNTPKLERRTEFDIPTAIYTWEGNNIEPIEDAPFMLNRYNYYSKILFTLTGYKDKYRNENFQKTWEEIVVQLCDKYKKTLKVSNNVKTKAEILTNKSNRKLEKIRAIYDFVNSEIEIDDQKSNSFYPSAILSSDKILKSFKGTRIEKNILLISMLRAVGLKAYPVLIATRPKGKFYPKITELSRFNFLICKVDLFPAKNRFLDASVKYYPFTTLPSFENVRYGLVIEPNGTLNELSIPFKQSNAVSEIQAIVDEEGNLNGKLKLVYSGYPAINQRNIIENSNTKQEYIKKKFNENFIEFQIDSLNLSEWENAYKPIRITANFTINNFAQKFGSKLMFSPSIIFKMTENVCKQDRRIFPIEFDYPVNYIESISFSVPENFTIEEIPQSRTSLSDGVRFKCTSSTEKNKISYKRELNINKLIIPHSSYIRIKSLFDKIIAQDEEKVVISKGNPVNEN